MDLFQNFPLLTIEGFIKEIELKEIIKIAENFPENISLQWISTNKIYIYIVAEIKTEKFQIIRKSEKPPS